MHKKGLIYIVIIVCTINNLFSQNKSEQIKVINKKHSSFYLNKNNYRKDKFHVWDNNNYFFCKPNFLDKTKNQKKQVNVDFTFTFDLPYPFIYMVSRDTYYWTEFNFINPYQAHYIINEGVYDVFIQFKYDSSINIIKYRFVINNNIQVDSLHTTLFVSHEQANNTILFKGVDENNNILWGKQNYHNEYWIVFNPENSYTTYYAGVESFDNGFYISDLFNSAEILISEMIIDTKENNVILNLQHHVITKITNNITEVTNSPDIYTKQFIEINQPATINGLQDIYFSNVLLKTRNNYTSSGMYSLWNSISFNNKNKWEGIFYLTQDYNSNYANSIISLYANGSDLTYYRVAKDSFSIFPTQLPTSDLYLSPYNDTIILGKGLMYLKNQFNNNWSDKYYIDIFPQSFHQMKDNRPSEFSGSVFNLYNSTGQLIKSTDTGWDVTQKFYTPSGKYSVEFIDTSYYVSGKRGKATMYNYFDLSLDDALPPVFNALQIRNAQGKPCELLKTDEQATIHFSLADTYFGDYGNRYYQSILPDSTKIFVKKYQSEIWTEINYQIITEDTVVYGSDGGYYMIVQIPEEFTAFDSSAIDLRIVFQDSSFNKTDFMLEPAVAVGNFKFPFCMPLTVTDYYQVLQDSFLIVTTENSVLINDTCEEAFGLTAQLVSQPFHGSLEFYTNGSFKYVPNSGYHGEDSFLYKAFNGGEIPSVSQKVVIEVKSINTINDVYNSKTELFQNYPNPFSNNTIICFSLKENSQAELSVFTQNGKKVALLVTGVISKGKHQITWQGKNNFGKLLPNGVYYYRLQTNKITVTKKMIFMK